MPSPRSMWTGSLSFGLVNIPIKLLPAVREQRVAFHLLHDQDMVRLKRKMVSSTTGREVHPEHIVKGFEVDKGQYVVIRQEEIEGCSPEKSKAIEISDFVDLADIDPVYYDRPYYVLPQAGAAKSYRLLVEAMRRTKKVGIARFVFHEKEYLAAIRPVGEALCLETMHFHAERVPPADAVGHVDASHVADRELKAARQLVSSNMVEFKPDRYHDEHLKKLRKLMEKKAEQHKVVRPPAEKKEKGGKKPARALDLMAALEASLAAAKSEAGAADDGAHRRRRKSA
jgi:DNA end-binding protein Ku